MTELSNGRLHRHQLVTAAHDFLIAVLPFRYPDSGRALARFLASLPDVEASVSETHVILLDVLAVINAHARCPNLLDRYVAARRHRVDPIAPFRGCVDELIRHRAIGDKHVERALTVVETHYRDDTLTQAKAAELAGLSRIRCRESFDVSGVSGAPRARRQSAGSMAAFTIAPRTTTG